MVVGPDTFKSNIECRDLSIHFGEQRLVIAFGAISDDWIIDRFRAQGNCTVFAFDAEITQHLALPLRE